MNDAKRAENPSTHERIERNNNLESLAEKIPDLIKHLLGVIEALNLGKADPSPEKVLPGDELFETFVTEKQYLERVTDRTLQSYREAWKAFNKYGKAEITSQGVKEFMIEMAKSEMEPGAANSFARSINPFLTWLYENKHTPIHLKIPMQTLEKRVRKTYTPEEMKRILSFKPVTFGEKQLIILIAFLIDTGARINEALTLERSNVDLDNQLITLYGKGRKQRRIPISPECRDRLARRMKKHRHSLVFSSQQGTKLRYDNLRPDLIDLLKKVGVEKSEDAFHAFRRYFAREYIRNGGNVFYLQKMLGHSTLDMSKRYMELDTDDLQQKHKTASPLANLIKPTEPAHDGQENATS